MIVNLGEAIDEMLVELAERCRLTQHREALAAAATAGKGETESPNQEGQRS